MKILHVIPSISSVHGGPSAALETMTRALADAGMAVEVATTNDDGAVLMQVPLGEPVVRENVTHWFFARQTQFYKFSMPLTQWLAQNAGRFDVIHLHALFSYATLPAAFFAARARVPYIVRPLGTLNPYGMTQQHPLFKRVSFGLVEKRILAHAAFVHYTSATEERAARALGVTTPSRVIPHGLDEGAFQGARDRTWVETHVPEWRDRVVLLFLSRLDPIKQIEVLLDACMRMRDVPFGLVIAGDGDAAYVQTLHAYADEFNLKDRVFWAGYVQGKEKRALLSAVDAFVLPSASENFGIAVVEAMAAGLPVIVTPEIGIATTIVADRAGLMVSASPEMLAEAMRILVLDEARRRAMGVRAKQLARAKFSVAAMRDSLITMYQAAIGK